MKTQTPGTAGNAGATAKATGNFIATLQNKTGGVSLGELDDALASLALAVQQTAKKGVLTLKLTLAPNGNSIKIEDDLTVKTPKPTRGMSFAFVGPSGELLRNDPNQTTMEFTVVPGEEAGLRAPAPEAKAPLRVAK